ncbi:hypothetical protein GLOTRDRAFT_136861 [Gloeophyllum trabeum ATCC 11539]|uniref:Chromo domain-containing protein n=1 Tax=Gloeophyllum trabeum (strain ATCC 11539 / FP-39264 / Madison 617) TaxID=670483 RepID=S7QFA5_GLOTA|nr:uncharacterized protein GLOTRDRAFT_136861 [Gloeophyllum trabeum ATCC 11539]EPQ58077.1 hypothetical protein GLOTRDRAFT_136861 [Gloeophyllum trabeum ATCC 11539]
MAEEQDVYEVETIVQAKVAVKRGKKLQWKYYVKWKGFDGENDNTWEPIESFSGGSEHFLSHFWSRVDVGGRDITDATAFKKGEIVFPVGPPRMGKGKSPENEGSPPEKEEGSHVRTSTVRQTKREPETPASTSRGSASKRKRDRSPAPVEPSPREKRPRTPSSKALAASAVSPATKRPKRRSTGDSRRKTVPVVEMTMSPSKSTPAKPNVSPRTRKRQNRSPSEIPPSVEGDEVEAGRSFEPDLQHATDDDADGVTDPDAVAGGEDEDAMRVAAQLAASGTSSGSSQEVSSSHANRSPAAKPVVRFAAEPSGRQQVNGETPTERKQSGKLALRDPPSALKQSPKGKGTSSQVVGPVKVPYKGVTPRKSSLLTFAKGTLATMKGKFVPERPAALEDPSEPRIGPVEFDPDQVLPFEVVNDDGSSDDQLVLQHSSVTTSVESKTSRVPPAGEQLLEAAGSNSEAGGLPASEDVQMHVEPSAGEQPAPIANVAISLNGADPETLVRPSFSAMWSQSTIFGPLGLGASVMPSNSLSAPSSSDAQTVPKPFLLAINPETTIPIAFQDANLGASLEQSTLDVVVAKCQAKGPPGKLYKDIAVVNTLTTSGSSARVVPHDSADERHREQLAEFHKLLGDQHLFLAVAADSLLAFCSSENRAVAEKLGVPAALIGLRETIIASHVSIQDHSTFVDFAVEAESVKS